ncbi:hypothetical protein THAOC_02517, partial [Thalassiosira oceanica]
DVWLAEPGRPSMTGGALVRAARAQHPDVRGGHSDAPEAWPVPAAPDERERPLPGSGWDKSGRLSNNDGDDGVDLTLGLLDADEVLLSPPPRCFKPEGYGLPGDRCSNGCQQVTGGNVRSVAKACPPGLQDCPERYHDAFTPHPDPKNPDFEMNRCPAAFPSCNRENQDASWPSCLEGNNIGYVSYSSATSGELSLPTYEDGELYVTACTDKKLLGPFQIVKHVHDTSGGGKIYFDYTNLSVNYNKPGKETSLWEGMTSCWKMDADKIEEITDGKVKTDYFRFEQRPKFKVLSSGAFDADREWWHYGPGERLCVISDAPDVAAVRVRVKQRGTMLSLRGSENVRVAGLKLFATEFNAVAAGGVGRDVTFDALTAEYPGETRLEPAGLTNSVLRYGSGVVKSMGTVAGNAPDGAVRCVFSNNLIEYAEMAVELTGCAGADVVRNTIHHIYNGDALEIYGHGCDGEGREWNPDTCPFEVALNRIHDVGFNGHCDCSGVQTKFGAVREMRIQNNWIYSLPYHKGLRCDTGENGAVVAENVIWDASKGAMLKGGTIEGHKIVQNTAFGSKDVDFSVVEFEYGDGSTTPWKPYNTKTSVFNNAVDDWRDSGKRKCTEPVCVPSPGYALKEPNLSKPWAKRWEKCDWKKGPVPCIDNWDDMSPWLQEWNKKTGQWKPTGVGIDDPGCQSGPLGKYNTLHYGTCVEGKQDWATSGGWPRVAAMLRDVGNYDFRPKRSGAPKTLLGRGKHGVSDFESRDIGAYEADGAHYSIPGRIEATASSPVPPDGAFSAKGDADLMFLGGANAEGHALLLGSSFCDVATRSPGDGSVLVDTNIYTPPGGLKADLRYYWRVDVLHEDGSAKKGPVWCFDVEDPSNTVELSKSWNMRTTKSSCTLMSVDACGDAPSSAPTLKASLAPTPEAPHPSCQDDISFRFQGSPKKSCQWVAQKPGKRCGNGDPSDEKTVREACPVTCDACCQDDPLFRFEGHPDKNCGWVAKKPNKRCRLSNSDGLPLREVCPVTCDAC